METQSFLLCVAVLTVTAVSGCPIGREFITAFMTNYQYGKASPTLSITAQDSPATVKVEIKALSYSENVNIGRGETKRIVLPANTEIEGDGVFRKTVSISSTADISVVSSNLKEYTGDSSVIFPMNQLGKNYVVFTPNTGPNPYKKLVAIINGNYMNTIDIVSISGYFFKATKTKTINLAPYEVYQLRSLENLSGTKITSTSPVAVLAGHECSMIIGTCEHVFEQLVPIEFLSNEYLVPAMHQSFSKDTAFVIAPEDNTVVSIFNRNKYPQKRKLNSGDVLPVDLSRNAKLIQSSKNIMVMYFSSNFPNDEFLTNIIPTSEMSKSWTIHSQDGYDNTVVVVAEAASAATISGSLKWKTFPANEKFVWATKSIGSQKGPITISGDSLMAAYVFGGKPRYGYATTGVCNTVFTSTPPPPDPCETVKCRQQEECRKGVCVPTSTATCHAVGDPHYKTFDGKLFDFQGTCTYVMANNTKPQKGLTPFTILAKNNHRGSKRVAYVRTVSVLVYNHTVVAGSQRGVVEFDGENTYLPLTIDGGKIKVDQRGWNVIISTDFGLEVKYDWNMMLYITAPSSYFQTIGGLCGNYNGDRRDEYIDPKGKVLSSVIEFAKTWKVPDNDLFCNDDCNGQCPSCSLSLQEEYKKDTNCGVMAKTDGPFANCHNTVDPHMYVDNCVYDVCINNGIRNFLCNNIQSYVGACMSAGIKITGNWRTLSNCPLDCPVNMHYDACGTACAASCADRDGPGECTLPCVEGCQCNAGFVRSGDECIPVKKCGCTYKGRYYLAEQTFWGEKQCTEKCVCNSQTGKVDCTMTKCKKSQVCDTRNGVKDCYPMSYSTCQGAGDPHYRTFDGKAFDFQGTCTYYLSKLLNTADPSLIPFEVLVKNENRGRNMAVAYTKTVSLKVYGYTIVLSKDDPGKVKVNNLYVNLPFEQEDGRFSIFRSGYFGVIKTDFDLTLKFNWDSHVSLTLPSTYYSEVGGLCGNWNANANDDLLTPNKTLAATPTIFGTSWKVKDDPGCSDGCQGKACPKCDATERNKVTFTKPCSKITDKQGPFKGCHNKVNPNQFYEDCVYDMCMYGGHSSALCSALSAYTAACQDALGKVESWRTNSFCPASCMDNSHYEVCATGCPQTCHGLTEPKACEGTPCIEGCICDEGFVLSNGECVAMEQCGCSYEGRYYQLGQEFFPQDKCQQRCVCKENGKVQCNDGFTCKQNEKCQVLNGVQGCFPESKAVCSVSGFGLYQTFDGKSFTVEGDCEYRFAETAQIKDMNSFSLLVKQQSSAIVFTRRVEIQIEQSTITLLPGHIWEVQVDNVKTNLPVTVDEGLAQVYQSGVNIVVETDFGLKLTYDTVSMVKIEIPSTFKNSVKGLCGNYNGNSADDFLMPNGIQTSSVVDFAEAWVSASDKMMCQTICGPKCLNPDKDKQTEAETACSMLIAEKGPFSGCYEKIPPQKFFDECVKDVAAQPKDTTVHCRHIQRYVTSCQEIGMSISSWRNKTFCPLACLKNSHYELCADTCSSTCASLTSLQKCPMCQEGCQCDDGFLFDGGECKPLDDCGCYVDGKFYKSGETVIRGECEEKCFCKAGEFSCEPLECNEDQICGKKDGAIGCYNKATYCPVNMHYDACGTACAASCADRDGPGECTLPCVEGCQCNAGFVRSGDECIPVKKCGCTYKGRYYLAEQTFWGEKQCTEKCVCNSQTGIVECTPTKCKNPLVCGTRNGMKDCYPMSYSTCQGAGDPHYRTFDGKAFDFQGTCTYYLSKLLNTADPSLIPFEVLVKNENRGRNMAVAYTKTVSLTVYGYTIVLSKESPRKVKVNNLYMNLPFELEDGRLSIFYSGYFGVIKTDFDLTLKFNWDSHVSLTLPSTYYSEVGGLCGNWNDKANDDLLTPNNTLAATPTIFGTSWKVKDDPGCSDGCQGKACPKCDATERNQITFTKPCSKITDKQGPFKGCHNKVNPNQFYEDCVYDMCMYGGHASALCSALSAYTAACQDALGKVESWRTNSFCPTTCKAHSHYEVCATGCPQTCRGLAEPKSCRDTPCVEGCTCDNGFVLSDGECVAAQQCGCTYKNQYYQLGQEFFPQDKCQQRCVCKENGKVQCNDGFTCKPNEKCQVLNGVQGCFPESKAVCSVSGFGLYQTFDGKSFTVEGDCEYRLAETAQIKDMNSFSVLVKQQSSAIVFTRRVEIQIKQSTITLLPGHIWEVQVDNVKTNLPVTLNEGLAQVYQSGVNIVVETDFGLKLTYDTVSMVKIEIPSTFKNSVKGLCGNYNGNSADDFLMPDGIQTSSVVDFAEAWVSASDKMMCQTICGPKCLNPDKDKQTEAETACSMLISEKGPFSGCYEKIPPQKFFDECVKDVAAQPKDTTVHCRHIQRYVTSCQEIGMSISSWRNKTFCPLKCLTNSHYELCADTCSSTCASLTNSQNCPPCQEGCQCDDGFLFDGGECKPLQDCGCYVDGKFYQSGETVIQGQCKEKCLCKAGVFSCEPLKCDADQICGKKDGAVGCYNKATYCPVNMHYDACGTACAASCADRDGPDKCTLPCVEGCQCNAGFVRSGDECIPVKKCGCTYKGRYYLAEQTFWGEKQCTEKCVCNSQTGKVDCTMTKCKKSQVCDTRNGVKDCYPMSYSTCQGAGDPHYRTFDGKAFDFQGTCTYYLSKLLNTADPSLIPFEVLVKNENRGRNMAVAYTKTVSLKVYGYTIVLSKESPRKVKVNNLYVNLPFELEDGRLSIFYSGYFGVIKTDFDLTLKFNWDSHVSLTLPSTYYSEVGGLCGNWNDNANDDLLTPNNTLAATPTIFGTSWKVKDDPGCSDGCQGKACPKCDATERNQITFTKPCSKITDKQGPFKGCHNKVNPNQFYEDCVYDMCMYGGHASALCSALSAYTAACQDALGKVESWRTNSFCPTTCKAHSHYEVCATGCQQTCRGLAEPKSCIGTPCVEGCTCDNGFVLSDGECVAAQQCGCTYKNQYYQLGQEFFPQDKCQQRCVCKENGKVQCNDGFTCKQNEKCQVLNGVQGCFPESKAVCSVSGFGLYQTFDGKSFTVEGDCEYRLAETAQIKDMNSFSLLVKQQSSAIVFTRRVEIQIEQSTITLLPGHIWEVQVDKVKTNLPVTLNEGLAQVYQSGVNIVVETGFGLKLTYDTVSMVKIEIPSTFKNSVKGLCGNYNGNSADDFLLPDGIQTSSVEYFAEAWVLPSDKMMCQTICGPKCLNPDKDKQTEAETACSMLISEKGPFSGCYEKIPPQKFFDECVKDVAAQPKDTTVHCRHIQRYVTSCQEIGMSISSWRNKTFCPLKCLTNSHYELCADTCSSTCASLTNSQNCPLCQEGCQCDDGFLFDGGECKPLQDCGCYVDGKFYKSDETVIQGQCKEKCLCKAGVFSCEPLKCDADRICDKIEGVTGCYKKDPCSNYDCREQEYCTVKDNKALCIAKSKASCIAKGDPHYKTFDGNHFSFQGTCSYTLVKTSGKDQTLTPFSIVNKNDILKGARGSYVKSATITVRGHEITFIQGNRNHVTIDGTVSNLPVSLNSEGINITQSGTIGVMQTDFGLEVMFNWADTIMVTLSSSYYNNIVGMCGTYSNDLQDDYVTPSGNTMTDITEWAKSWSVPESNSNCWHFPPCSDDKKLLYSGQSYCGLLENVTGPFAQCHDIISKRRFAADCLFQMCLSDGSQNAFCNAFNNYVSSCALVKADVSPEWKKLTNC
ncbi:IgGFc-binding protein [Pseudorasbora parva]|uniref:IgGFc-binding protein n=1 Tax=Pseudorasbora parva TaxID=51549 RepID=UPI00351DC9C2